MYQQKCWNIYNNDNVSQKDKLGDDGGGDDGGGDDGGDNNIAEVFGGDGNAGEVSTKDDNGDGDDDGGDGSDGGVVAAFAGESPANSPDNVVAPEGAATTGETPAVAPEGTIPLEGAVTGENVAIPAESALPLKSSVKDNNCNPAYSGVCIPFDPSNPNLDLDCKDISDNGFPVSPNDPNGLDGIGCESGGDDDYKDDDDNGNPIRLGDIHIHTYKKIIKYSNSKCTTQKTSIPLGENIAPRTPILVGDFYPCKLKDGRATLNLPNNPNLQFAVMHLDKKGNDHEGMIVEMDKIQNLNRNNALFILDFNDKMQGKDPITGKEKTIKNINAIALFNKSQQTIDFNSGSSLALSAVLKS